MKMNSLVSILLGDSMKQTFIDIYTPDYYVDFGEDIVNKMKKSGLVKIEKEFTFEYKSIEKHWSLIDYKDRYFYSDGTVLNSLRKYKIRSYGLTYLK